MTKQVGHRGHLDQGPQHERRGDVVGQVGHQVPGPGAPVRQQPGQVEGHGVALDDLHAGRFDDRAQHGHDVAVRLHRHHRGPRLGQGQGQGTEPRADLEDLGARARHPIAGRSGARCWDRRRNSVRAPCSAGSRAPTAAGRCRRRKGSPGDCDFHHSLARVSDLREALGRHVDDPRVARVLTVVDGARRRRPRGVVGHGQHRAEGKRRARAVPVRRLGVPRGIALFAVRRRRWRCRRGGRRRRRRRRRGRRRGRWRWRRGRRGGAATPWSTSLTTSSRPQALDTRRGATAGSHRHEVARLHRCARHATACIVRVALLCARDAVADEFCNNRRGAPKSTPQMTAATPRRLPPVLWFRRAPPFSGDTVHPRRHTGGEGFLENLDNQSRRPQTRKSGESISRALFPGHGPCGTRYLGKLPGQRRIFCKN